MELRQFLASLQRLLLDLPVFAGADLAAGTAMSQPSLSEQAASAVRLLRQLERDPPPALRIGYLEARAEAAELENRQWGLAALEEEIELAEAAVEPMRQEAGGGAGGEGGGGGGWDGGRVCGVGGGRSHLLPSALRLESQGLCRTDRP